MRARGRAGFTLVEVTIILMVLAILAATLAPAIGRYLRQARIVRAREDVQALGCAIWMYIADTANSYFMLDGAFGSPPDDGASRGNEVGSGAAPNQASANRVDMLVSDGDIPQVNATDGDVFWRTRLDYGKIDLLAYHLATNTPGNNASNAYRTPQDYTYAPTGPTGSGNTHPDPGFARNESAGLNSEFAWRGPYMTAPIDPDPWGNRYAANVQFLDPIADSANDDSWDAAPGGQSENTAGYAGYEMDCIVLSAGPDEEIDTWWNVDGNTPGDDDILYTVSSNSRP